MLRITINGTQVALNTRRRCKLKDWDLKKGMPVIKDAMTDDLNLYLEGIRNRAYMSFTDLSREFEDVTPHMVRDHMQGVHGGASRTIFEIWEEHNREVQKLIGKEYSHALWQKHTVAMNHFRSFLKIQYRLPDMPVKQIRFNVIREYNHYLIGELRLKHNTAIKFLQFFKKITNRAIKSGWLVKDPFDGFSLTLKEVDPPYLTEDELNQVQAYEAKIPRIALVKDLFIFSCFTGMAYADVKKLVKGEIERTPDGMWWIKTRRQKTKQRSQIPLLMPAKQIIDKYTDLDLLKSNDLVLPVLSNQKLNAYLKEVAVLSGIEKNLTFHVARHTFATTVTLQNGVSIESVSRMLGHSNIKTTQHYARVVDKKIARDMMAMSIKANLPLAY